MTPSMVLVLACALLFGGMLAVFEIGRGLGRARRAKYPDESHGAGGIEAAILGLLGLTLAFTFSGASDRIITRRAQIVEESNKIGTAYLRIDLLPASDQPAMRDLFRRYLESRITTFENVADVNGFAAANARSGAIQREIWTRTVASCRNVTQPGVSVLVLSALNEMIDISNTRNMAIKVHVPPLIVGLLVALALMGAVLSGYAMSAQPHRSPVHMVVFAMAITAMVFVVLDLEYPRVGFINLSVTDQAMQQLRDVMK